MEKEKQLEKSSKGLVVYDGTGLLLGRLASKSAKAALLGSNVAIINAEKVIVSGSKKNLLSRFKPMRAIGKPFHGPFQPRMPDKIVKRTIRGMLPFHKARGREAYRRVKCYIGIPEDLKNLEAETIQSALAEIKLKGSKSMTIGSIASLIGKWQRK